MGNQKPKVAVLGAGMTGLSAANRLLDLGYDVSVFEEKSHVGGLAMDCSRDGFTVDLGPHYIFDTLAKKIGVEGSVKTFPYYEELYDHGRFYTFPFGMMKNPRYLLSVGAAYLRTTVMNWFGKRPYEDLQEALTRNYGRNFANEVLGPLLRKWSGADPKVLSLDLSSRLEPANLDQILFFVKKLVFRVSPDFKQRDKQWVYPEKGIKELFDALTARGDLKLFLNERIERIHVENGRVTRVTTSKKNVDVDFVVSTLPINQVHDLVEGTDVFLKYKELRFRPVLFYFMRYARPRILNKLWTWFPDPKYPFYRVSEPKNVFPSLGPPNETQLTLEIGCDVGDRVWKADPAELAEELNGLLSDVFKLSREEFKGYYAERSQFVYPVYLRKYDDLREGISYQSPIQNLFWGGRVGQFKYIFLEECHAIGQKCAELIHRTASERSPSGLEKHAATG